MEGYILQWMDKAKVKDENGESKQQSGNSNYNTETKLICDLKCHA